MSHRNKCGCLIADGKDSDVRKGYSVGGYVKEFCDEHNPRIKKVNNEKIKQSDVAWLRPSMLEHQQDGRCAICDRHVPADLAALDHCHRTGRVRGVLHRDCNILLGKIENFVQRYGRKLVTEDRLRGFLHNAGAYMYADYKHNPLHYKHKTEEDKLLLKYRRLLKRSKKPETKRKYREMIKELTDEPTRKSKG